MKFEATKVELPFASEEFREIWQLWCQHRKEIKKPLTPTTVKLQLRKIERLGEAASIEMITRSIENQWQGLFESGSYSNEVKFVPGEF